MIINGGIVEKLNWKTLKHPRPYRLQLLNGSGEVKYEVLWNVVPIHAGHILLGQPWQYDRRAAHDDYLNHFSFLMNEKPITPTLEKKKSGKLEKMRIPLRAKRGNE